MTQSTSVAVSRDAAAAVPLVFQVEIFVITTPQGSFSSNEAFWKRINEQCLDPGTSDLLQKNGLRVGVAQSDELTYLDKFLDGVMPVQRFSMTAAEVRNMEIEMKTGVQSQNIFHFDKENELIGRSFDESTNLMTVSFSPAPRRSGQLRMTLCPMVRAMRKRMQLVGTPDQFEIQYVSPEAIYDMNFTVDIPFDSFLIVTPSPDAERLTSVGNAFFIKDAPAERQEKVLLVLPWPRELHKRGASPANSQARK